MTQGFNIADRSERTPITDPRHMDKRNFRLVKFCEDKYNLARGCRTVSIGTTSYFRNLESTKEISDETEGIGFYNQTWKSEDGRIQELDNMVRVELNDSYIFCASMDNNPKFECYEDKYYINDVTNFGKLLTSAIKTQLTAIDFAANVRPPLLPIQFVSAEVLYGKVAFNNESLLKDPDANLLMELAFRKPLRYQQENEFRLMFIPITFIITDGRTHPTIPALSENARMIFNISDEVSKYISLE